MAEWEGLPASAEVQWTQTATTMDSNTTKNGNDTKMNYFTELSKLNVSDHVEKKGGFSYLSWPYAVSELRSRHPTANWEVIRFNGLPFLQTEAGCFVEVAVTVEGVRLSQIHPVLDTRNKPIQKPDAFQINTSLQRALVKAIALHGLGLYIYAGEDLPDAAPAPAAAKPVTLDVWDKLDPEAQKWLQGIADCVRAELDAKGHAAAYKLLEEQGLDADHKTAIWSRFDSRERAAIKKGKEAA